MDLMLDSRVFMYPQYLPRMAFQPKLTQTTAYAPSEYQLIAIGLEKHLALMVKAKRQLRKGADPIRVACKRMIKDTICGKTARRIFLKIAELRNSKQYNPVKYFFEHRRAPPANAILWGFAGGLVRTPRERHMELPSGWQYYIEVRNTMGYYRIHCLTFNKHQKGGKSQRVNKMGLRKLA